MSESVQAILDKSRRVAALPISVLSIHHTDVFYLIKNIPGIGQYIRTGIFRKCRFLIIVLNFNFLCFMLSFSGI